MVQNGRLIPHASYRHLLKRHTNDHARLDKVTAELQQQLDVLLAAHPQLLSKSRLPAQGGGEESLLAAVVRVRFHIIRNA